MAITKTYINGSFETLKSWLEGLQFFGSVELDDDSNPTLLSCKDADGNTLATFSVSSNTWTIRAYADASAYASVTFGSNNLPRPAYGYACANGGILQFQPSSSSYQAYQSFLLIAKTNNDKPAFIISTATAQVPSNANAYTTYHSVAWGDSAPLSSCTFTPNSKNQASITPFCTNSALGVPSYTPQAFWLPFNSNYNMGFGSITINGYDYLTNGYWAIRDEAVTA